MNRNELESKLGARAIRFYKRTGSTNTDAINWLKEEPQLSSGAVVVADEQENGRGRFDRHWMTPPGSAIAMSVIIKNDMTPQQLAMTAGLSVLGALKPLITSDISLKWPNDILLGNQKVGGCLIETVSHLGIVRTVIVGIGINVSVDFYNTELSNKATSLSYHTKQIIDRIDVIKKVLDWLDYWINSDNIFVNWKSNLSTIGQQIQVYTANDKWQGLVLDVKENGVLLLQTDSGDIKELLAGDVSLADNK